MIEKLKNLYEKYKNWVVIILLILFILKNCQLNSMKRSMNYEKGVHNEIVKDKDSIIDSMVDSIESINDILLLKSDSIETYYKFKLDILKESNDILKSSNEHYRSTNKKLVDTNNLIINKEKE